MRILVHDYAGHPFTAELSRKLAERGHVMSHTYFSGDEGPKGRLSKEFGDSDLLSFHPLATKGIYSKKNFVKRRFGDVAYGRVLARHIVDWKPELVISGNAPTEVQEACLVASSQVNSKFVYWCQDFYSLAVDELLRKRIPVFGAVIGSWYKFLDRRQMQKSDHVVLITDRFRQQTERWRIPQEKISVIPNWGVLDEIKLLPQANAWSEELGLSKKNICLYSGTLARKHDPSLLYKLAEDIDATVVVVAAGVGVDELRELQKTRKLDNLKLLPLQPFERFSEVLATASVFVGILEEEAGQFSVPSKVLSYLCAGRPIVLSAPADNLAAQIVSGCGAGKVVLPEDREGFVEAVNLYLTNVGAAKAAGEAGRVYAEENFDVTEVAHRFEAVFDSTF